MTDVVVKEKLLNYIIQDPIELNLSFMPFLNDGGIFVPTNEDFALGETVLLDLLLPGKKSPIRVEGKVVWITPNNALHHVLPGIGLQFSGPNTQSVRNEIETNLDPTMEVGGYTYGTTEEAKKS